MAEDAQRRQLDEARWDAALRGMDRDVVRDQLSSAGSLPGTTFPLPDGTPVKREYVVAWLGRMAEAEKATERWRFRYLLWPTLVAALGAAIAAWPVIRDWLK